MAAGDLLPGIDGSKKTGAEESAVAEKAMDPGIPRMSPEMLRKCCEQNKGYAAPELNELMILHYKGFRKIEGLGAYTNVRSLFLECNGISKIENLEAMPLLVSLYLQNNCIRRIENLEGLVHLQYLNLAHNNISEVENLGNLTNLETLNLGANKIDNLSALAGLADRPSLKSVDISCNYIEDGDGLLSFWSQSHPDVECLYLHHNPCSRALKDARRRLVSTLPRLRWVDERPVTALERAGCEAWAWGGKDAELAAKQDFWRKEKEDKEKSFNNHRRMMEVHAERAKAQKEAQAARDAAREKATAELETTGVLAQGFVSMPARPDAGARLAAAAPTGAGEPGGGALDRQAELRAKVDALLASRRRTKPAHEAVADTAPADTIEAEPAAPDSEETAADATAEAVADTAPAETIVAQAGPAAPDSEDTAADATAEAEEEGQEEEQDKRADGVEASTAESKVVPFEWSNFRDRRLGRLVADFRYNFNKAASALSQEFDSQVSSEECRRRYGELCRPARHRDKSDQSAASGAAAAAAAAAGGRAKDGPPPDPAAVKEVSKWFMRRIANGPTEGEWTPTASSSVRSAMPEEVARLDEEPAPVAAPLRGASPWDSITDGAAAASTGIFAPPPRSAPATQEVKVIAPQAAPASTSHAAVKRGGADGGSLFDLD